jgi:hypothetical protein
METHNIKIPSSIAALWTVRQERIKKDGSEFFTWKPAAITAGAIASIELFNHFPLCRKYMPLDFVQVVNNETTVPLALIINGAEEIPVMPGAIITVTDKRLYQIGLRNDHAVTATTLNKVIVTLQRQPITIDAWARKQ